MACRDRVCSSGCIVGRNQLEGGIRRPRGSSPEAVVEVVIGKISRILQISPDRGISGAGCADRKLQA